MNNFNSNQSHQVLSGQYILCKSKNLIPVNFSIRELQGWYLGYSIPVVDIITPKSFQIGYLLGYPISLAGILIQENLVFSHQEECSPSNFEEFIYELGGRFVAILITKKHSRIYLDPAGSLATVWCEKLEIIASQTSLIPYIKGFENNEELINKLEFPNKDIWFPFSSTPRNSIERLLPNHFLDLNKWYTLRHWPSGEIEQNSNIENSILEISSILKIHISAIANKYPIYMSLTAGRDSRVLLACARNQLNNIIFFTREMHDEVARIDCEIAPKIANYFGLNHVILKYKPATETELNEWLYKTGYCVAGRVWKSVKTLKQLDPDRIFLPGLASEVGRSYYWNKYDTASSSLSESILLKKIHIPAISELKKRAFQWLEELPTKNSLTILDLLYIEQRLGCWAGPLHYGLVSNGFVLSPFVHRKIFEIMLSLPPDYRRNQLLTRDLISTQWSELLYFPFNEYIGVKKYFHIAKNKIYKNDTVKKIIKKVMKKC